MNFFIYYDGDISASDIKSARIYVTAENYYWTLHPDKMLDTEKKMIGGWFKFFSNNPNVLPIGQLKAEIILNNGERSSLYKTIPAPGSTLTDDFSYVYTPEEISSYSQGTPLIQRAVVGASTVQTSTQTLSINFSVNDNNVYNGIVLFYDANGSPVGYSAEEFRDHNSTSLSPIINSLNTDGSTNTITIQNSDIKYQNDATFNDISKYIVVLTDGSQYADQGLYSSYDCSSISAKVSFTTSNDDKTLTYLYVANVNSNTVTYFNAATGAYINGTLENSSFSTGHRPSGVAVNASKDILYVTNSITNTVTLYNATTGDYINGNFKNSSFATGDDPSGVAVNALKDILYVTNAITNTVTLFNATTGGYINGNLDNSSFITEEQPFGVCVNPSSNILYVTSEISDRVTYFNATTGAYLNGTLENSSFTTGDYPVGVAINTSANILYVANAGSGTVTFFNATTGDYLNGSLINSSYASGTDPYDVACNLSENILYVTNCNSKTITYINATNGDYLNGNQIDSTFTTGDGPAMIAINSSANILYVTNRTSDTVTFFDAATGDYLNDTLIDSSFVTGGRPFGIAYLGH